MNFTPKGFVDHERVLEAVARHLFPDAVEDDGADMSDAKTAEAIQRCVYHLRNILVQRRIVAVYHDPLSEALFGATLDEIVPGFWLTDDADRCILMGQFGFWDGTTAQIYFRDGAIEAALQEGPDAQPVKGGRPQKADAALAAYHGLYPSGHLATGDTWKQVVQKVTSVTGESVSVDTLRNHLKTR